ncbi:hypothetical protein OBBRIDRAFT_824716 [Obba rivulosa]|uniref:Uncharacterized protein n=1 Tax=Obba rivulosa TaxID=1052685 RepID=A0A8E2AWM9_9APHY|nr:hypothetical protein OBBRIDRAFT_824716 [Obba rivulosa]
MGVYAVEASGGKLVRSSSLPATIAPAAEPTIRKTMEDEDMDIDYLTGSPQTSSQWVARARMADEPAETDIIRWQPSQSSSAAFNALLQEASRPMKRHTQSSSSLFADPTHLSTFAQASSSTETLVSATTRTARPRSRLLRRTSSATTATAGPSTSAPLNTELVELIKSAAQLVDEHASVNKRYFESQAQRARVASSSSKSTSDPQSTRGRSSALRSDARVRQSNSSNSRSSAPRSVDSTRARPSATMGPERTIMPVYDQSVEMIDAESLSYCRRDAQGSRTTSSRPRSTLNISSSSIASRETTKSQTLMPPPPIAPRPSTSRPSTTSLRTVDTSRVPTQSSTGRRAPPSPITPPMESTPPPPSFGAPSSTHAPRPSQSSRPPALGMRRTHNLPTSTFAPSQALPTRQRGFKPPLARPPARTSKPSSTSRVAAAATATLPTPDLTPTSNFSGLRTTAPQRTKYGETGNKAGSRSSSPAAPEADSSYGELPFDINALEEEMRKYD